MKVAEGEPVKKTFIKILVFLTLSSAVLLFDGCSEKRRLVTKEYGGNVTHVELTLSSSDIELKSADGDKITLEYYDTDEGLYSAEESDGKVSVSVKDNDARLGGVRKKYRKMTLSLPLDYSGDVTLITLSGDISVKKACMGDIAVSSESGEIKFESVEASKVRIKGTTSETALEEISAESVTVETVSGDITSSNIECGSYSVSGESASLKLKSVSVGKADVSLTSGDATFDNVKIGGEISVSVTSGRIDADGIDASAYSVVSETGDIDLDNIYVGSSISITSESGDISVYISDPISGFDIDAVSEHGRNNFKDNKGFGGAKKLTARNVTGDITVRFYVQK